MDGTALFLAKNGISESSEFHFGGSLIVDDPDTPDAMRQNTANPARKKVMERDHIQVGSDPKCKLLPIQIYIEAKGCDEDGGRSGYAYLIANTGSTKVEWHDGWSRDEAIYHAIGRGIEDVPAGKQVLFLVESRAVVDYFENDAPGRKQREMLRFLARTRLRTKQRGLAVTVEWIPHKQNLARRHLLTLWRSG